ncbi:MAG TPA: GNAT family N-acetyltransferase [Candidatus Omnitrophota bacterium]|nr:GNAT family N-acetyltransferase [Candidatus Omnitrophota bacterium]HRZ15780.1 GNAT family N-acetyltransferase [Candidatus Omnitrophota bacterium]
MDIRIRAYRVTDRDSVREIAWATAFLGEPGDAFFTDKELLCDFLTGYFTDYEPQSCFVAEAQGRVVGYIIGALDAGRVDSVSMRAILPRLVARLLWRGVFCRRRNRKLLFHLLKSFLKGEFFLPAFNREYPATLHINIARGFRGQGTGGRLLSVFCDYLKSRRSPGVRLATMSETAREFFSHAGFVLLATRPRSYFRYLGRDLRVYILGKTLV